VDDEVGTGEVPDDATGQNQRQGRKPSRYDGWPGDRGEYCLQGCGDVGGCLIGLTTLIGASGGLFAAVVGAGRTGSRLRREARAPRDRFAAAMYRGVRYYQLFLSARRPGHGGCQYTPTCSDYAAESLRRHGALKGTRLAARRLSRCRPSTIGGVDPVP
jgi:putative membrane protein insertion efficiency factor